MLTRHRAARALGAVFIAASVSLITTVPAHADPGSSGSLGSSGSAGSSGSSDIYLPIPTGAGLKARSAAVTQIGKPYKWGGTGPNSWDYSGLVRWAFSTAGVSLPRVSQQQAKVGRAIPVSALAPGDIIIFYRDASHVGIYAGAGQVFNAYGPNGVPIGFTPLSSFSYIKTVRRFG